MFTDAIWLIASTHHLELCGRLKYLDLTITLKKSVCCCWMLIMFSTVLANNSPHWQIPRSANCFSVLIWPKSSTYLVAVWWERTKFMNYTVGCTIVCFLFSEVYACWDWKHMQRACVCNGTFPRLLDKRNWFWKWNKAFVANGIQRTHELIVSKFRRVLDINQC